MARAIYPGSFDPITVGHIDVIKRAIKVFDELIVAVVSSAQKQTLFSLDERKVLCETSLEEEGLTGLQVITWEGLTIECAKQYEAKAIVRGLRANSDFEREFQMALTNRGLYKEVESVFFMTRGKYSFLSSSIVKEVKRYDGDISQMVTPSIDFALQKKFDQE
jgi:pantetheine-phosphate adenylyltransferase